MEGKEVAPPSDWFLSLILSTTSEITYFTLPALLATTRKESKALVGGGIILGRKSSVSIGKEGRFESPIISRSHAQLNITPNGHVYITDLASMHKTNLKPAFASDQIPLDPFSPIQLLEGDTIELGKRLLADEVWYDPIQLKVKFRYPELGKGSTQNGERKKIGKIKSDVAQGKFLSTNEEDRLRRIVKDTQTYRYENTNEIKIATSTLLNYDNQTPFNTVTNMSDNLSSQTQRDVVDFALLDQNPNITDDHDTTSSYNTTHNEIISRLVFKPTQPRGQSQTQSQTQSHGQGLSKYSPINIVSPRPRSPISIQSDSEHGDSDQENTAPEVIHKRNTYGVPASVLYISEEEQSLPRGSSEDMDLDNDSVTDYEDSEGPEIMGVREADVQIKPLAVKSGSPSPISVSADEPVQPLFCPYIMSPGFAALEPGSILPWSPITSRIPKVIVPNPAMASEDPARTLVIPEEEESALYGAWYSYSSEDEEDVPRAESIGLPYSTRELSPYYSPVSPVLSQAARSPSPTPAASLFSGTRDNFSDTLWKVNDNDNTMGNNQPIGETRLVIEPEELCEEVSGDIVQDEEEEDPSEEEEDQDNNERYDEEAELEGEELEGEDSEDDGASSVTPDNHTHHAYYHEDDNENESDEEDKYSRESSMEISEQEYDSEEENDSENVSGSERSYNEEEDAEESELSEMDEDQDEDEDEDEDEDIDQDEEEDDEEDNEDVVDADEEEDRRAPVPSIQFGPRAQSSEAEKNFPFLISSATEQKVAREQTGLTMDAIIDHSSLPLDDLSSSGPVANETSIHEAIPESIDQSVVPVSHEDPSRAVDSETCRDAANDKEVINEKEAVNEVGNMNESSLETKSREIEAEDQAAPAVTSMRTTPGLPVKDVNTSTDDLIARPRTPSISEVSSEGPITPPSAKKRSLPEEFTIINSDQSDHHNDIAAMTSPGNGPTADRPIKRLRRVGSTIGLIALGAALGSVGTIAGLMQLGE
ncbi:uncharacterized protein IL334_007390 [Kwoniella shivajii]|uniref:FHA domain-containing protein n=1 Tax=Kwoniella shivajii TaxID=564305 RepID=A0ABZ1DCH7_9TREE|nr:hypothetical protein IL334_007390 [Kwoniella shivajii]